MPSRLRSAWSFGSAIVNGISDRNIGLISAGVAFYGLFSIFPAITSLVTLWGFFADPDIVSQQLASYEKMMPAAAYQILSSRVHAIASGPKQVLGWATVISIAAALWSSRAGTAALIGGLNAAYLRPPRAGILDGVIAMLLTLVLVAVALISMATVVVAPIVLSLLPLGPFAGPAISLLRWLIGIGVVLLGIGILYRIGPNHPERRTPLISTGSVLAVLLWAVVSMGFSVYLNNFAHYNEVYGSLGAVIAMLMWFYLSAYMVLLGGLVNAELERRRVPDKPAAAEVPPSGGETSAAAEVPDLSGPPETATDRAPAEAE